MGILSIMMLCLAVGAEPVGEVDLASERTAGELEVVATFEKWMLTGVTNSRDGRLFVNFPRWGDNNPFTVAEVVDGRPVPYPNEEINRAAKDNPADHFLSVQSVVVGPKNRLWVLDTGSIRHERVFQGGPKLVAIDLETNEIVKKIVFKVGEAVLPTTYLNDVRFDLRRGEEGMAFITDSSSDGPSGIIVVDLASGKAWRRLAGHKSTQAQEQWLPKVEGRPMTQNREGEEPSPWKVAADGIAIGAEGDKLYYSPLSARFLYSVSVEKLADPNASEEDVAATVEKLEMKGASDGLESDAADRVYVTDYEHNAIRRRLDDGTYETIVHDPRVLWPDTLSVAHDGYLYFTVNQLHRQAQFHNGEDLREPPYAVMRVKIDAEPVSLK